MTSTAYTTEWIKYPDIKDHCIEIGAKLKPGRTLYTLPVIHDSRGGGVVISDSVDIAEYLDTAYPDTPILLPKGTKPLQLAFSKAFLSNIRGLYPIILPATHSILDPRSQEYFRHTREKIYGKKLEEFSPVGVIRDGHWKQLKDGLDVVDGWLADTFASDGKYLVGDSPKFVDIVLVARLMWMKVVLGENSEEWKDLSRWNGGRWNKVLQMFEKYARVV
jgi:glutathione S-transferase